MDRIIDVDCVAYSGIIVSLRDGLGEAPYRVGRKYPMAMMGIGMWEVLFIGGIALVFIGPEKFPDFAKIVIRTVRDLRGYVDDVKAEVVSEINPLKKEMHKLSRIDPEKYIDALVGGDDTDDDEDDDEGDLEKEGAMADPYFEYAPSVETDSAVVDGDVDAEPPEERIDSTDGAAAEEDDGAAAERRGHS